MNDQGRRLEKYYRSVIAESDEDFVSYHDTKKVIADENILAKLEWSFL